MSTKRLGREAALWVGGVLGSLCLASLLAGWLFNVTPLVFASGSMSPAYEAGALGVAREVPASDLRTGDVVSVIDAKGDRVTHRIVGIAESGDGSTLTLQGDTNPTPDAEAYRVSEVDRVVFGIPYAGYALNAAASPLGLLVGGVLVIGLLYVGFRPRGLRSADGVPPRKHALVAVGAVSAVALGGAIGLTGQSPFSTTSALWSDSATANATITAVTPDTTPPSLTLPLPATGSTGIGWSAIDCANSGAGVDQICVTATDAGSGINTVNVKLVRTSGTPQCWNGSAFINGTACSAQPMTLLTGNQYRTTGLTSALMTLGTYTATYNATDVAGNAATQLVTTFSVIAQPAPAAPVLTACVNTANGSAPYRLTWTWGPGNPDSFAVVYSVNPGGTRVTTFAGTLRTGLTVDINNEAGNFKLVAITGGVQSVVSNQANYSGNGGGKACSVVP